MAKRSSVEAQKKELLRKLTAERTELENQYKSALQKARAEEEEVQALGRQITRAEGRRDMRSAERYKAERTEAQERAQSWQAEAREIQSRIGTVDEAIESAQSSTRRDVGHTGVTNAVADAKRRLPQIEKKIPQLERAYKLALRTGSTAKAAEAKAALTKLEAEADRLSKIIQQDG